MSLLDRLKLLAWVAGFALLLVLAWHLASPLLVGWPVFLYLCYRAAPGVRADVSRLYLRFFPPNEWRIS